MLELLVAAAFAHAKEKLPSIGLATLNKYLAPVAKRRLGILKDTYTGADRPKSNHVVIAAWAAFHSAIAEVIESTQATVQLQIKELGRKSDPFMMETLVERNTSLVTLRRIFDSCSSEAKSKLFQDSEVSLPWTDDIFTRLAASINWAPTQDSNHLEHEIELRLKQLAIDRLNSQSSNDASREEFPHEKIRQLAPGGEFASIFFRHFANLADQHSVIWRPLISQQVGQLHEELKKAVRQASTHEQQKVAQLFEEHNLLEPRHWIKGVERLKMELRGEGARTDTRHFGGRAAEMEILDAWLSEPSSSRFLLTGPSGIGKSVLLQHWLDLKILEDSWCVIHIPFAKTPYDTADYSRALLYLCIRLSSLGETNVLSDGYRAVDDLADSLELILEKLSNNQILIAFDGLDELDEPDCFIRLLPKTLPRSIKVIFSARTILGTSTIATWRERLGMSAEFGVLELDSLGADGVRAALSLYGYAPNEERFSDLTQHVYLLTDAGDPLLFGFLMADEKLLTSTSAARALELADHWQEGYRTLFERWIDQEESNWRRNLVLHEARELCFIVLVLIAAAPAPLTDKELILLLPRILDKQVLSVRRMLRPIERLLVGDGQTGYQLSHPRLAEVIEKPGLLMEAAQLKTARNFLYEWIFDEMKQHHGGGAELNIYVATNATRSVLYEMQDCLAKLPFVFNTFFVKTCVKMGLSSGTYSTISSYLRFFFLKEVATTRCTTQDIATSLLRIGLFAGSLPTTFQSVESVPAIASAVKWGNLSSDEALAWVEACDRRELFNRAWPREQTDTIYALRPDQYRLPILFFSLDERAQDSVRTSADSRSFEVGRSSTWNFSYEGDAYLATTFLLLSFDKPRLRSNAERLLATLPSYRAASCISTVKANYPSSPEWLREFAIRVHASCLERKDTNRQVSETFDELFDWLYVEEAEFSPHLERLFQLAETKQLDPWWPPRRGIYSYPLDELERMVKLAGISEKALQRGLQLFDQIVNLDPTTVRCACLLAQSSQQIFTLTETWKEDLKKFEDAELAGPFTSALYGGIANVPEDDFKILLDRNPRLALGLSVSDTAGIDEIRARALTKSANKLDGYQRFSALLAISANSKKTNTELFREYLSERDWLLHDNIIATLFEFSSEGPRQVLVNTLLECSNILPGRLYAEAFAPLIRSREASSRHHLIEIISALPESTLKAHLVFLAGKIDGFKDKSHPLLQLLDGDSLACKCLRAAWTGQRWSKFSEPFPSQAIRHPELRGFFRDFLPHVLKGRFFEDDFFLSLLEPEDWVEIAINLPSDVLNNITRLRRSTKETFTPHYLSLITCAVAQTQRFDIFSEAPFHGNLGPWFGALGNIEDSDNAESAIASIEAEIRAARSGGYEQGWRLLVNSRMAMRPEVAVWIAGLYQEVGWGGLNIFNYLPKLAPSFDKNSLKQLKSLKMTQDDRLRCALASNDFLTRKYGLRLLERVLRRDATSRTWLGDPIDKDYDNWPFTSEYILSTVLAEGSESQQRLVIDRMSRNSECVFLSEDRTRASFPVLNFFVNFIKKSAPADAQAAADAGCTLIAEFIK